MKSMKKIIILAFLSGIFYSCGTQPIKNGVDYRTDLTYPQKTEHFAFKGIHIYDEPLLGASLSWINPEYPSDIITVYVYPIPATEWDDLGKTLTREMDAVSEELVYAVAQGHYTKTGKEKREDFSVESEVRVYQGLKSTFNTYLSDGRILDSNTYIFVVEDKYLKFRTSFDSLLTPDWDGDSIVEELLPVIGVPPESNYMKKLREEQRVIQEKQTQQLLEALLKAAKEGDVEVKNKTDEKPNDEEGAQ